MKKFILSSLMALVGLLSFKGYADTFTEDGVTYATLSPTAVEVTKADGAIYAGDMVIPKKVTHDGTTYVVMRIGQDAFAYVSGLNSIKLPNTINTIVGRAFINCTGLKSIDMGTSVTSIGVNAFAYCESLKSIHFPAALTSLNEQAFLGNVLEEISVDSTSTTFATEDGVLYSKDKTQMVLYPQGRTTPITFPSTVKSLGAMMFMGSKMKRFDLPPTVEVLGASAFLDVNQMTTITGTSNLKSIGNWCFCRDYKLTDIDPLENIQSLSWGAFNKCTGLKSIVLGDKLKAIDKEVFTDCINLKTIVVKAVTPPAITDTTFNWNTCAKATLRVPEQSIEAYKAAPNWSRFQNIRGVSTNNNYVGIEVPTGTPTVQLKKGAVVSINLVNEGANEVNSIEYSVEIDRDLKTYTLDNISLKPYGEKTLDIPVADCTAGQHGIRVTIIKVNGEDNTNPNRINDFTFLLAAELEITAGNPQASFSKLYNISYVGANNPVQHYDYAMQFNDDQLVGNEVIGMKVVGLPESGLGNIQLWSSRYLGVITGDQVDINQQGDSVKTGFFAPFMLNKTNNFFGVSMDVLDQNDNTQRPVPYTSEIISRPSSFYIRLNGGDWIDASNYGAPTIILYLRDKVEPNAINMVSLTGFMAGVKNTPINLGCQVQNYGGNTIDDIEYTVYIDGDSHVEKYTFEEPIKPMLVQTQLIDIPIQSGIATPGKHRIKISLDKVNGEINFGNVSTAVTTYQIGEFATTHRPIMEEFTGAHCGYCPRGTLGIAEMSKRYPEFIAAAYHKYMGGDVMDITQELPFSTGGAPDAMFDRNGRNLDPYWGTHAPAQLGIAQDYEEQVKIFAPANISLQSSWDADQNVLSVRSFYKFSYAEPGETYKVAYLLTIDGLAQEGEKAWHQSNYMASNTYTGTDNLLAEIYANGGFDMTEFNHVVMDASAYQGVAYFESGTIEPNKIYHHDIAFDVTKSSFVNKEIVDLGDRDDIHVIAFLIDSTGKIRNARKARAGETVDFDEEPEVGVNDIVADLSTEGTAVYYDLQGRMVQNPQHGIFIKKVGNKAIKVAL